MLLANLHVLHTFQMGYGIRALSLLKKYYEFKIPCLDEDSLPVQDEIQTVEEDEVGLLEESIEPKRSLPPLLLKLNERTPEKLDYLGVSYGLTEGLLKFWKRAGSKLTSIMFGLYVVDVSFRLCTSISQTNN